MIHWPTVLFVAAGVAAFLFLAPAPSGCGCDRRKRALDRLADEWFGDAS